jgi:hypothetical protein
MVVGSLAGAAAIHLAMLACSGSGSTRTGDGGANDAGRADVASVDGTAIDTGAHDAGFLDTLLDAVRDVIGEAADAEVRDAHAGGDAGVPACACPPAPVPPSYTFSGRANGLALYGPSSTARVEVRALPPGGAPFGTVEPAVQISVEFTAWLSASRTPSAPTAYRTVRCSGLIADGAGRAVGTGAMNCLVHDPDDITTGSDNRVPVTATLAVLTATRVEVRIASLAFPDGTGGGRFIGPAFTDLVFRATDPDGHYTAPLGAYVP